VEHDATGMADMADNGRGGRGDVRKGELRVYACDACYLERYCLVAWHLQNKVSEDFLASRSSRRVAGRGIFVIFTSLLNL
jgi:hypothetical protein